MLRLFLPKGGQTSESNGAQLGKPYLDGRRNMAVISGHQGRTVSLCILDVIKVKVSMTPTL